MSRVEFTSEQVLAIQAKEKDILVSAAAGSGKTAVLSERIIRLISEGEAPWDIDQILVVTFTRAAAASMREKIAANLSDRLAADPSNAHLRRQELLLPNAKIMTIDAFCQYILRNNFEAIGLDPAFRVADEGEIRLLADRALEEVLEEVYAYAVDKPAETDNAGEEVHGSDALTEPETNAGTDPETDVEAGAAADVGTLASEIDLPYLVEVFSQGATDNGLKEEILRLHRFSQSMPWPVLWLQAQLKETDHKYITYVIEKTRRVLLAAANELERALVITRLPGGPYLFEDTITGDIEMLKNAAKGVTREELHALVSPLRSGAAFERLSGKKGDSIQKELREKVREIRDYVKKRVKSLAERYYSFSVEDWEAAEEEAAYAARGLVQLTLLFDARLEEKKRAKNIIDFSDMEHLALQILSDPPEDLTQEAEPHPTQTALAYGSFFREVLIDEYQDSNFVQEWILGSIAAASGDCRRFMVGDVKQSIYRFRLARPELFMDKLGRYHRESGETDRRVDLHKNFRSRQEVLDFCNEIFARIMRPDVGGVDYDTDAMLRLGADYAVPPAGNLFTPELLLLTADAADSAGTEESQEESPAAEESAGDSNPAADAEEDLGPSDAIRGEAAMIAARIRRLLSEGLVSDGAGGLRKPRYSDIVILLRSTAGVDEAYRDVLTKAGIPVHMESKAGYFQSREVRVLTDLLAALENPLRDIPLTGVLRSLLFGFTDEELAQIRIHGKNRAAAMGRSSDSFYDAVCLTAAGSSEKRAPGSTQAQEVREKNTITDDTELADKCASFLDTFRSWREESGRKPLRDLLEGILVQTHYEDLVGALPAGAGRRANVRMLLLRAADFEKAGGRGLTSFVDRLEAYRRVEVDFGEANALSEDADLVRIMSIHKSKGLEYPIVFVAGLSRQFNRQDERTGSLTDEQFGIGVYAVDAEQRTRLATLRRCAIADRLHEESLGEEIRVLYVAMTRAKEKLILTASVKEEQADALLKARRENDLSVPAAPLSYLDRVHANSYMELLRKVFADGVENLVVEKFSPGDLPSENTAQNTDQEERKNRLTAEVNSENIDRYLMEQIRKKLDYTYAHKDLANLYVKTTVTELKERMLAEEAEQTGVHELYRSTDPGPVVPSFLREEKKASGAARGTVYHKVMEKLDAEILGSGQITNKDLISQNRNIVTEWMKKRPCHGLSEAELSLVDPGDVLAFLSSDLGQRFVAAFARRQLYREKQFMMSLDARRVNPANPEGETVLLQGIVDAYFVEEFSSGTPLSTASGDAADKPVTDGSALVILDYKTDRIHNDAGELAEKYGVQLTLYAEALTRITGLPVKELWIWSVAAACAVPVRLPE